MTTPRKPAAYRVEEPKSTTATKRAPSADRKSGGRKPKVVAADTEIVFALGEDDPFAFDRSADQLPVAQTEKRKGLRFSAIFLGAAALLLSMAAGLWVESLLVELFARAEWLGWAASGAAAVALAALLAMVVREAAALLQLRSVEQLRSRALEASSSDDTKAARRLVGDLERFTSNNPLTAKGRETLASMKDDIIDAGDLVAIAERELLAGLDAQAKALVLQSAKRVSVITAVSPRALIDVAYVLFESGRLIRRISQLYGGRPGMLGFIKLIRDVAAHLAVTGSIAIGDSLVQQLVGHGLAARLSARLGEGVVNGLMTVRIGIAAMETARPLPFNAIKRPGVGEFLTSLAGSHGDKT